MMKAQKVLAKIAESLSMYGILDCLTAPSKLPVFKKYGLKKYMSIIFFCIVVFTLVTIYYAILSKMGSTIHADQMRLYFVLTLFLISISVWVGVTPWGKTSFDRMASSFKSKEYANLYNDYRNAVNGKTPKGIHTIFRIGFIFIWLAISIIDTIIIFIYFTEKENEIYVFSARILFFASMFLNMFSYYGAIRYVVFLQKFSSLGRNSLINEAHNQDVPSASPGLQTLLDLSRKHAIIFFSEVLFYTLEVFVLVYPVGTTSLMSDHPLRAGFLITSLVLFGIATFILVYFAPMHCLQKVHACWKEDALQGATKTLSTINKKAPCIATQLNCLNTLNHIKILNGDRLDTRPNGVEITVSLSTILINIANVIACLSNFK